MAKFTSPEALETKINELKAQKKPDRKYISICGGTGCIAGGGHGVYETFKETVAEKGLDLEVIRTGCHGFCERVPSSSCSLRACFTRR